LNTDSLIENDEKLKEILKDDSFRELLTKLMASETKEKDIEQMRQDHPTFAVFADYVLDKLNERHAS
jgi:hypothetical protein